MCEPGYLFYSTDSQNLMSMRIIESADSKGLNPRDDDSVDLQWGLWIWIFIKPPNNAYADRLKMTV